MAGITLPRRTAITSNPLRSWRSIARALLGLYLLWNATTIALDTRSDIKSIDRDTTVAMRQGVAPGDIAHVRTERYVDSIETLLALGLQGAAIYLLTKVGE